MFELLEREDNFTMPSIYAFCRCCGTFSKGLQFAADCCWCCWCSPSQVVYSALFSKSANQVSGNLFLQSKRAATVSWCITTSYKHSCLHVSSLHCSHHLPVFSCLVLSASWIPVIPGGTLNLIILGKCIKYLGTYCFILAWSLASCHISYLLDNLLNWKRCLIDLMYVLLRIHPLLLYHCQHAETISNK